VSDTPRLIRILVVDDHALFREGLARLLGAQADLEVVAHCSTAAEGHRALASMPIDLVLLDVDLGNERGSNFLAEARQAGFEGPVLVVTAGITEEEATRFIAQGAAGIFFKQDSAQRLADGIRTVADGRAWIDQRYLKALAVPRPEKEDAGRLTQRERQVLRGVFDGLVNKEIAERLKVSESSVKATIQQRFHKTGVRTRSQLVRIVLEEHSQEF
jgi:DNA-binding NarL/FixJ family response regulator